MLHRCIATNRCCPKVHEDDFGADGLGNGAHIYSNPYMHEDMSQPSAMCFDLIEGADFPPGAVSLMYDPPMDDELDDADGHAAAEEWVQDVDDLIKVPKLASAANGGLHPRKPTSLGVSMRKVDPIRSLAERGRGLSPAGPAGTTPASPSGMRRPAVAGSPATPRGFGVHVVPAGNAGARGRSAGAAFVPPVAASGGDAGEDDLDGSARLDVSEGSPARPLASPPGRAASRPPRSEAVQPSPGDEGGQPRSMSRSLRDAQACQSEAGAASISAIMQCVQASQAVPAQQRPNSEKWAGRWAGYNLEKHMKNL